MTHIEPLPVHSSESMGVFLNLIDGKSLIEQTPAGREPDTQPWIQWLDRNRTCEMVELAFLVLYLDCLQQDNEAWSTILGKLTEDMLTGQRSSSYLYIHCIFYLGKRLDLRLFYIVPYMTGV